MLINVYIDTYRFTLIHMDDFHHVILYFLMPKSFSFMDLQMDKKVERI